MRTSPPHTGEGPTPPTGPSPGAPPVGDLGRGEAELAGRVPLSVALSGTGHAWSYVFLAPDRSRGITGAVIHPDGGIAAKP